MAHPIKYMRHRLATFAYLLGIAQPNQTEVYQRHTDPNWQHILLGQNRGEIGRSADYRAFGIPGRRYAVVAKYVRVPRLRL